MNKIIMSKKYVIEFEAPDDWLPMIEPGCWSCCPFSVLTKLGSVCHAKEVYDRDNLVICPVVKLANKQQKRGEGVNIVTHKKW